MYRSFAIRAAVSAGADGDATSHASTPRTRTGVTTIRTTATNQPPYMYGYTGYSSRPPMNRVIEPNKRARAPRTRRAKTRESDIGLTPYRFASRVLARTPSNEGRTSPLFRTSGLSADRPWQRIVRINA